MVDYECPSCGGGFPESPDKECPWCGQSIDGTYGETTDSSFKSGGSGITASGVKTPAARPNLTFTGRTRGKGEQK